VATPATTKWFGVAQSSCC